MGSPTPGLTPLGVFEFCCRPVPQRFGATQYSEFVALAERVDRATEVLPIQSAAQLQLQVSGATEEGFRFTEQGFLQLARVIGPGLGQFLRDLASQPRTTAAVKRRPAGGYARQVWNDLVHVRLQDLREQGLQLVRDTASRLLIGVVSGQYHCFGPNSLVTSAASVLQDSPCEFYAAQMTGLDTQVWYRHRESQHRRMVLGDEWQIREGWYFASGDMSKSSARATRVLFSRYGSCLAPYPKYGRRLLHVSGTFDTRWLAAIRGMVTSGVVLPPVLPTDQLLKPLGFSTCLTQKDRRRLRTRWRTALQRCSLPKDVANGIISQALQLGGHCRQPELPSEYVTWGSRTMYDLLLTLLSTSLSLPAAKREAAEQVAFYVLTGGLRLPGGE